MAKRRGRLIEELSLVERVKTGYEGLLKKELIKVDSPIIIHRRQIKGMTSYEGDPREQYAVPDAEVHGTLPERILWKALHDRRLIPGVFTFQSGLTGGRLQLGGLVADFLCQYPPIVIRVQGSYWHGEFDRMTGSLMHGDIVQGRKDDEQGQMLNSMGYAVLDIWEETCYNAFVMEAWMNKWVDPMMTGMTMG